MENKEFKKAGVKDVAEKAGVSTGTVDRVLNKRGRVSEETRKKVTDIANDLGYKPNMLAKALSSKKTTKIIVCLPASHIDNPYWAKALVGFNKAKEEFVNFNIELKYLMFDASSVHSFSRALEGAIDEKPDGLVFSPVFSECSLCIVEKLNAKEIPFVFVDVNIKGVGKLAYFGQDASQSGKVAGMLMKTSLPQQSSILVVKMAKRQVFSNHIEARVEGFIESLSETQHDVDIIDVDLNEEIEPDRSLKEVLKKGKDYKGIFIPNSRGFKVAAYLKKQKIADRVVIGYDLLDMNISHLNKGTITFLINQKPEDQVYNAVESLFHHLILKKEINKKTYSPIDIVIKENIQYYK